MSKQAAHERAIELAVAALRSVDLGSRCPRLGLTPPRSGAMAVRLFGVDASLDLADWSLRLVPSGEPARAADLVLLLHYLACEAPVAETGELVSFRSLPGGQFYFPAFERRTTALLLRRIGNDLELLRRHLARFDSVPAEHGDVGARIHALGNLHLTLVYNVGDDELPPAADILFDRCVARVFGAEDAAVMASRICLGLL